MSKSTRGERIDCDHDILIKVSTNQAAMCKKLDSVAESQKNITEYIVAIQEKKVSWRQLIFVVGLLVMFAGGVIGYNFTIDAAQSDTINKIQNEGVVHAE